MSLESIIDTAAEPVTVIFQVFVLTIVIARLAQFILAKMGFDGVSGMVDKVLDRLLSRISH